MRNTRTLLSAILLACTVGFFTACNNQNDTVTKDGISQDVLDKVNQLGFSTANMTTTEGGYIVEGDIFLSYEDLNHAHDRKFLRVGTEEQYHTTNLVKNLPRTISISISSQLPTSYVAALDEAIRRYNAENLQLTFVRVASGATISIVKAPNSAQYLASAGFPTSTGNPHNQVLVNSRYLGSNPGTNYLATILAHEIGHCIGFRHTDYMGRQYSCGGQAVNEGASTVGAILIPGTPSSPDPNSWMLACIGSGVSRPFNSNDKVALNYLY
ncbi:MAG: protease [Cytophagales bacterium]|nr:MAG: protease [Cytophagales bacterium]